jgi:Domain of unknown function (DU1801)
MKKFSNPEVAAVFQAYPKGVATKLFFLRQLIFATASKIEGVGELEETLKWGQPSYVTAASKSGSTIRIDQVKSGTGQYAIYFHCQTTLVKTFRQVYPHLFKYGGDRSILFDKDDLVHADELSYCIGLALTYHLKNKALIKRVAIVG